MTLLETIHKNDKIYERFIVKKNYSYINCFWHKAS